MRKRKERIVYVVDDHFELPKKYLDMSIEEIDELICKAKAERVEVKEDLVQDNLLKI